jgi:GrpB-like predicted nucleotidyltransferase (UPF0157 family)
MPPPIPVVLMPHSPDWAGRANAEAGRLKGEVGHALVAIHHIGSTAIPGIAAKPVIDMMPIVTSLPAIDALRERFVALGYEWHGEYGIPGRRYCVRNDPVSGRRLYQLHCFEAGSPQAIRHLAFRDHLRRHLSKARAYEAEKMRARDLHPNDSHAYTEEKSAWIERIEAEALAEWKASHRP